MIRRRVLKNMKSIFGMEIFGISREMASTASSTSFS